jgi:hypothetical protein
MRWLSAPAPHWCCQVVAAPATHLCNCCHGKLWRVGAVVDDDLALQVALLQLLQHAITGHVICSSSTSSTSGGSASASIRTAAGSACAVLGDTGGRCDQAPAECRRVHTLLRLLIVVCTRTCQHEADDAACCCQLFRCGCLLYAEIWVADQGLGF